MIHHWTILKKNKKKDGTEQEVCLRHKNNCKIQRKHGLYTSNSTMGFSSSLPYKTIPVPTQDHANQSSGDLALVHKDLYTIMIPQIPLTRIEFQILHFGLLQVCF